MNRIAPLQKKLAEWQLDALLIENPVDLLYLTGLKLSKGRLLLSGTEAELWVDGRYFAYASETGAVPVRLWDKQAALPAGKIGFDSAFTTVEAHQRLVREQAAADWKAVPKPLKEMRAIKEEREIAALRKAAELTWAGILHMKRSLRIGVSERELAWEFERYVKERGASALSFEPIVAFGKNSALPHHRASSDRLENNQIVLFDAGAVVDDYAGDATRTYFFGEPDPELKKMYGWVREAHLAARNRVGGGTPVKEIDRAARSVFAGEGAEKLFIHSLGHGIGLETHEYPLLREDGPDAGLLLQERMVFTIEPGLYLTGRGGVRLEDTGVVEQGRFVSFYPELEKEPLIG